jgi:hypothetical protein
LGILDSVFVEISVENLNSILNVKYKCAFEEKRFLGFFYFIPSIRVDFSRPVIREFGLTVPTKIDKKRATKKSKYIKQKG